MKINRGRFRHRNIETSPGETTRPITARVKVSLFERLHERLQGARVADVFAGTGTMGLEALSRGARSVVFVENDRDAFKRLKQNVEHLGVKDETICWPTDAARCSYRPHDGDAFLPFDVIFFDPPYATTEHLSAGTLLYRALSRLARPEISAPSALLVLRCRSGASFDMPPEWQSQQVFRYSSMDVHLFEKPAAGESKIQNPESKIETPVTIRPAAPSDLPLLGRFIEPFVAEGRLLKRTFEELEQLLPHAFLALDGEAIVGCVALEIYSKKLAEVRTLAVAPEYRSQGIGRRLVHACLDRARERDILEVMAITSSEEFFQSCGFDFTLPGEKKALFVQLKENV